MDFKQDANLGSDRVIRLLDPAEARCGMWLHVLFSTKVVGSVFLPAERARENPDTLPSLPAHAAMASHSRSAWGSNRSNWRAFPVRG